MHQALDKFTIDPVDFSMTDKVIRFAIGTIIGTPQMVSGNYEIYLDKALELLPLVCWEQSSIAPFSSIYFPKLDEITATQNYGLVSLPDFYKIDRVQANIGGNINLVVSQVDGQTFFNSAQAYVATYPAIFWWNNLELKLYLYPIPTACILRVFGRRLMCKMIDRVMPDGTVVQNYPWLNPEMLQAYMFEYIAYSLSKALSVYYSLPWSDYKDTNLENLRSLLSEKQDQSFVRPHFGPKLRLGRQANPGTIFTLGKGPMLGGGA